MKGIIVAAGYGTRFLPVTKTIPKEMLPLINKPAIAFVVEEFLASGITDIVVISSRRKKAMEDYFDREVELESCFQSEGRKDGAADLGASPARIAFVRQTSMRGTGHALLQARPFIGSDPCVVAYPDDLHFGDTPLSAQLIERYNETGCSVMASQYEAGDVSRYGVIDPAPDGLHVRGFVEKPLPGQEPSHEVSIGRYLYTPDFFDYLEEGWESHSGPEYYHLYALRRLIDAGRLAFRRLSGKRLDTGEPGGYLEAILERAWADPGLRKRLGDFMASKSLG